VAALQPVEAEHALPDAPVLLAVQGGQLRRLRDVPLVEHPNGQAGTQYPQPLQMSCCTTTVPPRAPRCSAQEHASSSVGGPARDPLLTKESPERPPRRRPPTLLLGGLAAALIAAGMCVSIVPGLEPRAEYGAERFIASPHGVPIHERLPFAIAHTSLESVAYGLGAALLALAPAALGLWRHRLPRPVRAAGARTIGPPAAALKMLHSGVIGDYVAWLTVGTAVIGGIWAVTLR
jgi:hypothetical protein